jgi:outer membrane protein insertion porin family
LSDKVTKYIPFFLTSLFLSGCLGIKHLKDDEKLLYRQAIIAPKSINSDDLNNLYAQEPNRKFLNLPIAPLVGIYYLGEKRYDTAKLNRKKKAVELKFDTKIKATKKVRKIANLQFRKQKKTEKFNNRLENGNTIMQWGEPVAVFDSLKVEESKSKFNAYLFSQGYFTNSVSARAITIQKAVNVTYRINPGEPYKIDSIHYQISDSTVNALLSRNNNQSYLKKGDRYIDDNFSKERERIDLLLKDNGFYDFSRQYIEFEIDTSYLTNRRVSVILIIRDPVDRVHHKQFVVDSVNFNINAPNPLNRERQYSKYKSVNYSYWQKEYSFKILSQRVFVNQNNVYSRNNTLNTQRQLANLDAFKFVNINYDTSGGLFIANIFTSPLDRYEWSNEIGVNVTQGYPGPFYNLNFKKRNIFRGLENFDLNARAGIEGVASTSNPIKVLASQEASINASLTFPQFIWPLSEKSQNNLARYNPKTRITTGFAYTNRPEYSRTASNLSATYNWQNKQNSYYSLSIANLSIINSKIVLPEFQEFLDLQDQLGNRSLSNSFLPSFVSSILFSFTWNPDNYGNAERSSNFLRTSVETGGNIFNLINPQPLVDQGLAYFKFVRLNVDLRRITVLNKHLVLAKRFNGGTAYSFNDDKSLPYEKFFFAGGSNSVRAWRPRRLGPGSFKPTLSEDPNKDGLFNYQIEQPAEILLEGSIELRQKLFGFISGAVFVDAGNVWTRVERKTPDEVQGTSKFEFDRFYKEIGVGTGFGVRFDFSFLILRLDAGIKVYDPARDRNDRFVLDNLKFFGPFGTNKEPVIYNIGIGYPF